MPVSLWNVSRLTKLISKGANEKEDSLNRLSHEHFYCIKEDTQVYGHVLYSLCGRTRID